MSSAEISASTEPEDLSLSLKLPRRLFALTLGALAMDYPQYVLVEHY